MIAISHTLTSATLARLPAPEVNLAAYAVLQALVNAVKAPTNTVRQMVVALVDGKDSFGNVLRFVWGMTACFVAVLLIMAFTPLGAWALGRVGLSSGEELSLASRGLFIVFLLPIVETFRNIVHGLAISHRGAAMMPVGLAVRTVAVMLFLGIFLITGSLPGLIVGSIAWVLGLGIEGSFLGAYLIKRFGSLTRAAHAIPRKGDQPVALPVIARFFAPLAVMIWIAGWMHPLIQSGVGKSASPTISLAAYGVALGLLVLLAGGTSMVHQCTLVFVKDASDPNWRRVRNFSIATGFVIGTLMLLFAQSPVGRFVVMTLMGIPELVGEIALQTITVFAIQPAVAAWREAYWGMLMLRRRTSIIGYAKVANLATVAVAIYIAFGPASALFPWDAAVVGAFAYCLGEAIESVVVWRQASARHEAPGEAAQAA